MGVKLLNADRLSSSSFWLRTPQMTRNHHKTSYVPYFQVRSNLHYLTAGLHRIYYIATRVFVFRCTQWSCDFTKRQVTDESFKGPNNTILTMDYIYAAIAHASNLFIAQNLSWYSQVMTIYKYSLETRGDGTAHIRNARLYQKALKPIHHGTTLMIAHSSDSVTCDHIWIWWP
jgi:hypothetical protein